MNIILKYSIVFLANFLVMILGDMIWIGVLMKSLYEQIPFLARNASHELTPNIPAAVLVWVLIVGGNMFFALPRASNLMNACIWGSLYGFFLYGVYDFTNFSLFSYWPVKLTLLDLAWGTIINGALTGLGFFLMNVL